MRPTAERAKSAAASSGATKEQIEADINKAKASTKRHQRYKSKQKGEQEAAPATKSKMTKSAGIQESASKNQAKPKSKTGGGEPDKKTEKKKKRASGGNGANGNAPAP